MDVFSLDVLVYFCCCEMMIPEERSHLLASVRQRYLVLAPYLTEHTRRVWAAAEALVLGRHGNAIVSEATGRSVYHPGMIAQAHRRHRFGRKNGIDRLAPHAAQYGWPLRT